MPKDKYVGMDVHKSSTVISVLDKDGKLIGSYIVETSGETIRDCIKGISGTIHLTFEEGVQAAWLYDLLKPYVSELIVCDPRYNKDRFAGNKNDKLDSQKLAELLRTKSLKAVYHEDAMTRTLKELTRSYDAVVSDNTRVMNRIKAIYRGRAIKCSGQSVYHPEKRQQWLSLLKEPGVRKRAEILYSEMDHLKKLHKESKAALIEEGRKHKAVGLLMKMPGVGPVRAAQIVAIVAYPQRFGNKRRFWTYCGLAVVTRSSADYQIKDGAIEKRVNRAATRGLNWSHNRQLKAVFKATALDAIRREPFASYYQGLIERKLSPEVARVSVARKIAATVLSLWKKGEDFDPQYLTKEIG